MTRKRKIKKIIKSIIRNLIYFVVGVSYTIYLILKNVNNLVIKLFNKLPRLGKVIVIYTLIAFSVLGIYKTTNPTIKTIVKVQERIVETIETSSNEEETTENNVAIEFDTQVESDIYNKALELGLTHEQGLLVVSISRHETGNWTSTAFINQHNFGGIMCNNATKIKTYDSYESGLNEFVSILKKYYFDLGLTSVEEIGAKYCPVGAKNDPNGLNQFWVSGVSTFYNSYLGK
jgi:hypothetical protein